MNDATRPLLRAQTSACAAVALLAAVLAEGVRYSRDARRTPLDKETVAFRLDPNRASADELMLLPGIGPAIARNIVAYREARPAPAFRRAADLDHVTRVGPTIIARLRPMLSFPPERTAASAAPHDAGGEGRDRTERAP
ncbi:MAG: hypothetical protein CHACPFDD_03473 [Phycisphaerae bacterium]|nr:hypothetical protein [Phycisphaerae bacterium]